MKNIEDYKVGETVWLIKGIYIVEGIITSIDSKMTHNSDMYYLKISSKYSMDVYEEYIESNIYQDYDSAVKDLIKVYKQKRKYLKDKKFKIKQEIMEIDNKMSSLKNYIRNVNTRMCDEGGE